MFSDSLAITSIHEFYVYVIQQRINSWQCYGSRDSDYFFTQY
jgi:hypothetical protein